MADQEPGAEGAPAQSKAVAVRTPRQVIPVENTIPIFDTADFEMMGRISAVMAGSTLVPDCLQGSSSNCFLVVNQARRWNLDPFGVAQCASVVHGRLMWEGKLISAVIESKLKIKLDYHFTGEKGKEDYRAYVSDKPFTDEIIARLKPGASYRGWRIIDGSVGDWQTREKNGAVNQSWLKQPDMQLRYRGARTWCRVYESGIMLGIYTDDEMDLLRAERVDVVSVSDAPRLSSGFGDETDANFRKPAGASPAGGNGGGSHPAGDGGEAGSASAGEAGDGKSSETRHDADGVVIEDAEFEVQPGGAQEEEKGAAEAEAEETMHAKEQVRVEPPVEEEEITVAPPGTIYMIFGERFGADDKRQTYKDGVPFSTVTEKGAAKLGSFDRHAPEIEKKAPPKEEEQRREEPTTTTSASTATSSTASPSGTATTTSPPEEKSLAMPASFVEAIKKIGGAEHFMGVKQYLRTCQGTEDWRLATQEEADRVRGTAFTRYQQLVDAGTEKTAIPSDPFLFGLWMDFGAAAAAEIEGLFPSLMRCPDWAKMTEAQKNEFGKRMVRAKERFG